MHSKTTTASAETPVSQRIVSRFKGTSPAGDECLAGFSVAANCQTAPTDSFSNGHRIYDYQVWAYATEPPVVGGSGIGRAGLFTATEPPVVGGSGIGRAGLFTATEPPVVGGSGIGRAGLFTATEPPVVGGSGIGRAGLFTAIEPPVVGGSGIGRAGLLSANATAETVENTKSAARRKVENDDI
jgi:hypothetical protein